MKQNDVGNTHDRKPETLAYFVVCIILGSICILSAIAKTWFSQAQPFDWFALGAGSILCLSSLLATKGKKGADRDGQ
ncbi:hypothetical protein GC207_08430 [bacterium]|nr:hypothetical protein [bacterium]